MQYPLSVPGVGLSGGKFTGGNPLTGVPASLDRAEDMNLIYDELIAVVVAAGFTPTEGQTTQVRDAIQAMIAGLDIAARFTTTANISLNGLATQAGGDWAVNLTAGNIILVKDQNAPTTNGWYMAAAGAWTRVVTLDQSAEIKAGMLTKVTEGATLADTLWMLTTDAPIVLNTSALNFARKDALGNFIGVAGGTADVITTAIAGITAYSIGTPLLVRAASANATTTPSINVSGLGSKTIVKGNNLPLVAGDIAGAGHWLELQYDTVLDRVVLQNPANGVVVPPSLGIGQTWQNLTASRALGTTYTNSTGRPISIAILGGGGISSDSLSISINGGSAFTFAINTNSNGGTGVSGTIVIPVNATYSVSQTYNSLISWWELR